MPDSTIGQHLLRQVRAIVFVLFVLLLVMQIQLQLRNRDIARLRRTVASIEAVQGDAKAAAVEARQAARKASTDLTAAIKASRQPQDPSAPVPTALREIHEILLELRQLDAAMRGKP